MAGENRTKTLMKGKSMGTPGSGKTGRTWEGRPWGNVKERKGHMRRNTKRGKRIGQKGKGEKEKKRERKGKEEGKGRKKRGGKEKKRRETPGNPSPTTERFPAPRRGQASPAEQLTEVPHTAPLGLGALTSAAGRA